MIKELKKIVLLIIISIPTFYQMLRYGIYSMQDFHYFRLLEFTKCFQDLQLPCRWAADSGAGYGEPLFNFYGQFSYWVGEAFHLLTFSKIDSLKMLFILSLVLSGIGMFFLSRKIWKNDLSALISSVIYLYAPYRAVDVWVRAALPEAISFVFFPFIILVIENYLEKKRKKDLIIFSLLFGLLIVNHNLSIILFAPFLIGWLVFRFLQLKEVKPFLELSGAVVFSLFLSAFYILPVAIESKFVNINSTTLGVYDWRANFVTIYQLFISRFWGYGGSTWGPNDGLSLSVGQMQWIVPVIIFLIILVKRKVDKEIRTFLVLILIAAFALFLTHNKSTFIWNLLPFMKYIQFSWRFLSTSVFALALSCGVIVNLAKKYKVFIAALIIVVTIVLNFQFFRPDIWYTITDKNLESGANWVESKFSSLPDYWPIYGPLPNSEALSATQDLKLIQKKSNSQTYEIMTFGKSIEFPVAYFPGWELNSNGKKINIVPDKNGLISAPLPKESGNIVSLNFRDTQIRILGDWISLVSVMVWVVIFVKLSYVTDNRKL